MERDGRRYTQYKNLRKYIEEVDKNPRILSYKHSIVNEDLNNPLSTITYRYNDVNIDETWVNKIQELLPFVSNCIYENRRFIRNTGEIVDIEKVKKVNKDSIYDLSKNTNNIRKIKGDGEIEIKKLFVSEKIDDFAVYENKFLVFLINRLKSFVEVRSQKIEEALSILNIDTNIVTEFGTHNNKLNYRLELKDQRIREVKIEEGDKNKQIFSSIKSIEQILIQFLKTDLIEQVSKTPPIHEPIQKNNVLQNDPNFVKAVELFEFINSYDKDGFIISPKIEIVSNLSEKYNEFFWHIPLLESFLSYSEIKGNFPRLEEEFQKELSDENNYKIELLNKKIKEYKLENPKDLKAFVESLIDYDTLKEVIINDFKNQCSLIEKQKEKEIGEFKDLTYQKISNLEKENSENSKKIAYLSEENESLSAKLAVLEEENMILKSQITVNKIIEDENYNSDNVSEEFFNQLENEYVAFSKYFNKKWKKTSKAILKENMKAIRDAKKLAGVKDGK